MVLSGVMFQETHKRLLRGSLLKKVATHFLGKQAHPCEGTRVTDLDAFRERQA